MNTYNSKAILLTVVLFLIFPLGILKAGEHEHTHFIKGIFGTPPKQYEFRYGGVRGHLISFPLDTIKKVLGDEVFNEIYIDYWVCASYSLVELAMVEKMELLSLSLKNTIDFPLEDGQIGNNCWHSLEKNGTILFASYNVMVFVTPIDTVSFDPKMIENSARQIDSVLIQSDKVRYPSDVPVPEVSKIEIIHYPMDWDGTVELNIEAKDSNSQHVYFRKFGMNYDHYSATSSLTTTLNKNTDSTGLRIWLWNDNQVLQSVVQSFYFVEYPKQYVLSENDLPGYEFVRESRSYWPINDTMTSHGINHVWKMPGSESDNYVHIGYFEFENEQDAILATSYYVNSSSGVSYYGALANEILGNISYVFSESSAFIQKWNVGIRIYKPTGFYEKKIELLDKIIARINDSIPPAYLAKDEELKQNQIPVTEYNELTKEAIILLSENNFKEIKTDDTKWVYSKDSLVMGLRKQWANEKSLFSIDIVKLSNSSDAEKIGLIRDTINNIFNPYCHLDNKDSINRSFEKLGWYLNYPKKFFSATGVIDNYALFFHYQNKDSIDVDFFKSVLLSFAANATGINEVRKGNIKIYPNPANETFTIETQNTVTALGRIYNSDGALIKNLTIEKGINTYNISELVSGIYFIQILQKEGVVIKKLVRN